MTLAPDFFIIGAIVVGIVLDIFLATNSVPNHIDTISARAKWMGWHMPLLPFGLSVLVSHFWINPGWQPVPAPYNYYILAGLGAVWMIVGLAWRPRNNKRDARALLIIGITAIVTGLVAGAVLWSQRPISV